MTNPKKKTTKTKPKSNAKPVKREPTPSAVLKKVATVSDSNKALQKEIKSMSKIFADNQKVLVSMKGMIDTLALTLENIQKQSSRLNMVEDDTQKLYAGLNQVRTQSNLITKINDQTTKLQDEVNKINQIQKTSPKPEVLSQQVEDSMNSIRNNSQMIIKIAQRIDEVRDDLRNISGKTDSVLDVGNDIESLKSSVKEISGKTDKIESSSEAISNLRSELDKILEKSESFSNLSSELDAIKITIDSISGKAGKIDSLGGVIEGLKQQFETVAEKTHAVNNLSSELESIKNEIGSLSVKTNSISDLGGKIDKIENEIGSLSVKTNSISDFGGKIDKIENEIGSLSHRADSTAFVGEGLKSVQEDFADFKTNVFDKTNTIEQKVSSINDMIKRQDELSAEFHKKTDKVFQEMQSVKNVTNKVSTDTSKEMMALLKLSEYQSNMRMQSESKYGEAKDLENMASQTADLVNLFDRLSIESENKIPLPHEVRQWAVSKILDCADKWEIRFSDVFTILTDAIGRDLLKESIRVQQIRDIYGIRAVDEIRKELNIS
ncbi:MAG: chemotaxis protein [Nitrosopumilaceae archaeon]|uniref:Chemotaxis protein n=1 Tax=Candidatus Nitrosomaritimum aestuariumsis TaxID=3342354 RepID=A0AC60W3H8_9ARCH|nr:chemotaxis protein [Nitrosopumilaceae archaeon]